MNRVGPRQLRELLQRDVRQLLAKLFPGAHVTEPVFTPLNPTRDDKRPGSFVIWTRGPAAGGFKDYSPAAGEAAGDVLDLIAYVHNRAGDRGFAIRWAEDFLGIQQMAAEQLQAAKKQAHARAAQEARSVSDREAAKRRGAMKIWQRGRPGIVGTLAETYLASRGIPYRSIRNPGDDLRYIPELEWWKGAEWSSEAGRRVKLKAGEKFPALVAAMRNGAGDITAVHCTFLRRDGTGKADVSSPKLMFGSVRGAVIRLTRGPDNLTWEEAAEVGVLEDHACGEGVEDMLSVGLVCPELKCSAAGSFDNIGNFPIQHASVDRLYWVRDNDGSARADDRYWTMVEELRACGKQVIDMTPPAGVKDFNLLLQEG